MRIRNLFLVLLVGCSTTTERRCELPPGGREVVCTVTTSNGLVDWYEDNRTLVIVAAGFLALVAWGWWQNRQAD